MLKAEEELLSELRADDEEDEEDEDELLARSVIIPSNFDVALTSEIASVSICQSRSYCHHRCYCCHRDYSSCCDALIPHLR